MTHPNLDILAQFFDAYGSRDFERLRRVLAAQATWTFPGRHPLSGTRTGFDQVVAFFDTMGGIMGRSRVQARQLVVGVNDDYVVESQHVWTSREDDLNLDHHWCVLWQIENGQIVAGRHFASDQHAVDEFFSQVVNR